MEVFIMCGCCGLSESDLDSGWICPFDNPNEDIDSCEDCCWWLESYE